MAYVNGTERNGSLNGQNGKGGLSEEQLQELSAVFKTIDINGDGRIQLNELQQALDVVGIKLPQFEVRNLIDRNYSGHGPQGTLSMIEFNKLYNELKLKYEPDFRNKISKNSNVQILEAASEASQAVGTFHSVRVEEQVAFADWINSNLRDDKDLSQLLPLKKSGDDLYAKITDGLIFCKLINLAMPETIDERAINKKNLNPYTRLENLTLVLNSSRAIGCNIVNIDADDLSKSKKHLVLGLLWQIIRIGLFSQIDLVHVPGLVRLLKEGETLADLQRLSAEQILIRWVNYHMEQAGVQRRLSNFTSDIKDSEIYTYLLKQIAPNEYNVSLNPLSIRGDDVGRAEAMLKEASKINCRAFVTANDVANGVYKLNLAFVANLFNTWPGLKATDEIDLAAVEETREEKTYRHWMNSMGVEPYVNWLYSDLSNGLIIFQLYDVIKPGLVDWKKVTKTFHKLRGMMDQIQNCNYAVDLAKRLHFSLVGIQGKDIYDGSRVAILALVWQLMRAYTLSVLSSCTQSGDENRLATEQEIIRWANEKLRSRSKAHTLTNFQDSKLSDAKIIIDLIDAIKPNAIDYSLVSQDSAYESKLKNAKYAVSTARKIGAKVYALPEDIVEVKPKMVMTVFACLMCLDYKPEVRETSSGSPPKPANLQQIVAGPPKPAIQQESISSPPAAAPPAENFDWRKQPPPVPGGNNNNNSFDDDEFE